jgi:hypothetical protein
MQRYRGYLGVLTFVLVSCFATTGAAHAANFSFTGTFSQDDEIQAFSFIVGAPSLVTLITYSYAGGTNANGLVIPDGGFDPILSLFDSSGVLIDDNDDGSFPDVGIDPTTGSDFDTFLQSLLAPGTYLAVITQFDNFATGPTLADGFDRQGEGNYTGVDFGPGSGSFFDVDGFQRTNAWAFDILNVQDAQVVPEPSTWALVSLGVLALISHRWRRQQRRA